MFRLKPKHPATSRPRASVPSRRARFRPGVERLEDRTVPAFDVTNLGLASSVSAVSGDLVVFPVNESLQGNTDLNGDGDTDDTVLHVFDAATGTTTNLRLALGLDGRVWAVSGDRVVFPVNESSQGNTDLNGDGDVDDSVVHVAFMGLMPAEAIQRLAADIQADLVNTGVLNQGQGDSLTAKLNEAAQSLAEGDVRDAINQLQAFIAQVWALVYSRKLTRAGCCPDLSRHGDPRRASAVGCGEDAARMTPVAHLCSGPSSTR